MNLFKYNTIMLLGLFGGLCIASFAYATTSVPTSAPSVGHRPVMTGLVLGSPGGDITLPSTPLRVGDAIYLANVAGGLNGMDKDGDLDKLGAHCVWYKVQTDGTSTTVKDPGINDRNCTYTIQVSDIGFKLKNTIKIYSDQDIATQKGYTLNPIESLPVETISANSVAFSSLPFEVIYGPDTYIEVIPSNETRHLPPISYRHPLSPADLVRMPGGTYRISFAVSSAVERKEINALTLGHCRRSSGMELRHRSYTSVDGVFEPNSLISLEYSAIATDPNTGNVHRYFSTGKIETSPNNVTIGPVPLFPDDLTTVADYCSGIVSHLNTGMLMSSTFQGYVDMNFTPSSPLPQGREYEAYHSGILSDTLDGAPSSYDINIRLRALDNP